jgi:hypothetical protein
MWTFIVCALLQVACNAPGPTSAEQSANSSPIEPQTFALETAPWYGRGCAGLAVPSVLHGDPNDPHHVWIEPVTGEPKRLEVLFPPGYTARFSPQLVLMGPDDEVVGREGSRVSGYCIIEVPSAPPNTVGIGAHSIVVPSPTN